MAHGLARSGRSVLALSRSAGGPEASVGIRPVRLDIRDISSFTPPESVEGVIHCAALSSADTADATVMNDINARGSGLVAEWSARHNVPFFAQISSVSVYGRAEGCIDESSPITDPDAYGISKYEAEQAVKAARRELPSVSLRLPGVLGKGAHNIWLSRVLDTLMAGKPLSYYHPTMPFNNAVHVDDLLAFILTLSAQPETGHRQFVLGAGSRMTVENMLHYMKELLSSDSVLAEQPPKKPAFYIDSSLAQRAGYTPMTLEHMLKRYVDESTQPA